MIIESTFDKVCDYKFAEGLVFLGCGGDLKKWRSGITETLREAGILPLKVRFRKVYKIVSTGGRIDLVFVIPKGVDMGKLPIWRIQWGDCSWWSDYRRNYASHHHCVCP